MAPDSTRRQSPSQDEEGAALFVLDPSGQRSRVNLDKFPFLIGRQPDNHLVLRDNRASRTQARIIAENGHYVLEDLDSRHGTWVNGERIARHILRSSDRIDLGVPESYQLTFTLEAGEGDVARAVGESMRSHGWTVLELHQEAVALEDVFIQLVSQGAVARVGKEKHVAFPPVVDVTDPVGAGDTFDAGFIHQFIRGAGVEECLKFANVAGALSVTRAGGTEAFRDAAHRDAFIRKHATSSAPLSPPARTSVR